MLTLALDTAAGACSACIHDSRDDRVLAAVGEARTRGHAERLMALIEDVRARAGVEFECIERIAVTVGPGSFTGIRVGVATARGLALALGIDAVGVTTLEGLAAPLAVRAATPVLAVLDTGRGGVCAQPFDAWGKARGQAVAGDVDDAVALWRESGAALAGSAAERVAEACGGDSRADILDSQGIVDISDLARIAARRSGPFEKPSPVYLRDADAKPQTGFAVARLS